MYGQVGAESIPLSVHTALQVALTGYMAKDFERHDGKGLQIAQRYLLVLSLIR